VLRPFPAADRALARDPGEFAGSPSSTGVGLVVTEATAPREAHRPRRRRVRMRAQPTLDAISVSLESTARDA
jgi:hypothetical protein